MGWKSATAAAVVLFGVIIGLAYMLMNLANTVNAIYDARASLVERVVTGDRVSYRVRHPDFPDRTGGLITDWQDPESGCHYWITPDGTYVSLVPRWNRNGTPMCPDATPAAGKWVAPAPLPSGVRKRP